MFKMDLINELPQSFRDRFPDAGPAFHLSDEELFELGWCSDVVNSGDQSKILHTSISMERLPAWLGKNKGVNNITNIFKSELETYKTDTMNDTFDVVYCLSVLHSLPLVGRLRVIANMIDLLKYGGYLVLTFPRMESLALGLQGIFAGAVKECVTFQNKVTGIVIQKADAQAWYLRL